MFVRPMPFSSSQALSSLMRVPASARTSRRPAHSARTKSGSGAGTRAMPSGRSRKPSVSATSDQECPEPTARTLTAVSRAMPTIAWTSAIDSGR